MIRPHAWLLLVLLVAYFVPLGLRPLGIPDEARYAEVSREMIETGDWVVPRLLGLPYFEKPVGGYWLDNLSQIVFGQSNFAVRLPAALATAITALLVIWLGCSGTGDRRKGWLAGLIYLSSFMVCAIGTNAVLDPMLVMWLTGALAAFWRAFTGDSRRGRFGWWSAFGALCGGAFLTKGFVALAVPVVAIAPLMIWERRWRELLGYGAWSVAAAAVVAAPWALLVHARAPGFWQYFFWEEHIRRFAAKDAQHARPFWYFLPIMLAMTLPWTGAVPAALRDVWLRGVRARLTFDRFLLLAVVMPFGLFSIAKGKLATYILPCFAPFAILIAGAVVDDLDHRGRALQRSVWLLLVSSVTSLVALLVGVVLFADHAYVAGQWRPLLAVGLGLGLWIGLLGVEVHRGAGHVPLLSLLAPSLLVVLQFAWTHPIIRSQIPEVRVRSFVQRLPAGCTLASASVKLSLMIAWVSGRTDLVIVGGESELAYGLGCPEGRDRHYSNPKFPAWLLAERRQRPVVLFATDADARHLEQYPPADRIERDGDITVLYYDRRDA